MKVQILSPLSLIVTEFFRIPSQSNLSSAPSPSLPFSLDLTTIEHVSSHYQVGDNERRDGGDRPPHALSQSNLDSRITMKVYMVWRGNQSGNITQSAFCSGFQLCNSSRWQGRQIGRVYGMEPHSSSSKNITMPIGNHAARQLRHSVCLRHLFLPLNFNCCDGNWEEMMVLEGDHIQKKHDL